MLVCACAHPPLLGLLLASHYNSGDVKRERTPAKSRRCCLVGACKYFLFCYPLGKDSSNLGEQRRPKAPARPPADRLSCLRCVPRLPRLQVATSSGQGRVEGATPRRAASANRHQSSQIHQHLAAREPLRGLVSGVIKPKKIGGLKPSSYLILNIKN